MARLLKPLIKKGGYYPSGNWIPLVYPGGYTTANRGEKPKPDPVIKTVSGAIVHILDALAKPAISLKCGINPIQDLHGYDSPWPAGGGKNKFSGTIDGEKVSISLSSGTTLTASVFDANASVYPAKVIFYDSSEQAIDSWGISNNNSGRWSRTFTIGFDASYVKFESSNSGSPTKPMLEIGSSVSDYAPHSNICPISGRTGCEVSRTGKNLCEGSQNFLVGIDTEKATLLNANGTCLAAHVVKGETYVFSCTNLNRRVVTYWDEMPSVGDYTTVFQSLAGNTFTAVKTGLVLIYIYNATVSADDGQIELGSTATSYEQYRGETIPISWQTQAGTVYGGTLDVTTGVLTVTDANIASYNGETLPGEWISDRDVYSAGATPTTGAQVVYKLATPQTYQLDPVTVELLAGENNVWCDSGDVELTYYAEGTASSQEALGILLGGTYHNPGGADDVSDDEALQILLGGY